MEKVLVVDDEQGILEICRRILTKRGYKVVTAPNGEEALELMQKESFDLALIDLRMPQMDGFELLKNIKKSYPLMEVVIITAEATIEAAIETLKLGAFDYIVKPFNVTELSASVKKAIEFSVLKRKENIFTETAYLYQLATELQSSRSKPELLKFVFDRAFSALKANAGFVAEYVSSRGVLKLASEKGFNIDKAYLESLEQGVTKLMIQKKQAMIVNGDLGEVAQLKGIKIRPDISSSLIVPFTKHEALTGVVVLSRLSGKNDVKFNNADLEALKIFATHASLIITLQGED
ncbi:MAG: response regulator [Endomicrobiales bacterium]|nr:response regulator [Endomicrobiales bacterium]